MVVGLFGVQEVRREIEPLDITIEGKTIEVVFDIIDIGPKKDIVLGHL